MPWAWGVSGRQPLPAFLDPFQKLSLLCALPCHILHGGTGGSTLEAGRPRDLARGNCSHPSDGRGLSCVLGGRSGQESGLTGRDLSLAL